MLKKGEQNTDWGVGANLGYGVQRIGKNHVTPPLFCVSIVEKYIFGQKTIKMTNIR